MRGQATTPRALQDAKVERELHKVIKRNASDEEVAQAKVAPPITAFEMAGLTYHVCEVYRDSLRRLIVVGQLEDMRVPPSS